MYELVWTGEDPQSQQSQKFAKIHQKTVIFSYFPSCYVRTNPNWHAVKTLKNGEICDKNSTKSSKHIVKACFTNTRRCMSLYGQGLDPRKAGSREFVKESLKMVYNSALIKYATITIHMICKNANHANMIRIIRKACDSLRIKIFAK